jgi:hypothetical protein
MSDSCHLDRVPNVKIGVECQIFVIFFEYGRVLQFEAHSRYYKGRAAGTYLNMVRTDFFSNIKVHEMIELFRTLLKVR